MATTIALADAVTVVEGQAATDVAPTLTTPQVEALVERSARADIEGNTPGTEGWWPTYDLNAATALAWERKAALTATTKFDIDVDGQQLTRSQVYDHCMAQAAVYRSRGGGNIPAGLTFTAHDTPSVTSF